MADAPDFKQPKPHVPDGVVGDTLDEVPVPRIDPYEVPYQHTSPFTTPGSHVPEGVIGDTLDEVGQPPPLSTPNPPLEPQDVPTPPPHVPGGVIGDTLDEVAQPPDPSLPIPAPPPEEFAEQPLDPLPPPEEFEEVPMPPPAEPQDVPNPPAHVPDDTVDEPEIVILRDHRFPDVPPEALAQRDAPFHRADDYDRIMSHLAEVDEKLAKFVESRGDDRFSGYATGPGARSFDPTMHAKVLLNYYNQVGASGVATFEALQAVLHSMNVKYGKIFNPMYLPFSLVPFRTKVAMDTGERAHQDAVHAMEPLEQSAMARNEGPLKAIETENSFDALHPYQDGTIMNHGAFVDLALPKEGFEDPDAVLSVREVAPLEPYGNGLYRRVIDHSKIFDEQTGKLKPQYSAGSEARRVSQESTALAASSFNWRGSRGVIPAAFDVHDEEYGYVTSPLPDDVTYVPLLFQDLRPGDEGELRHVYFRALNLQTSEAFTPNWNEEEAWGRVDPVVGYRSTGRGITVSFMAYAFAPEDLPVIYKKRNWLTSMVYPEIGSDLLLRSGPVIRLRVGDLYNNSQGGLPGIIRDLNFADTESTWELKKGYKVPKGFEVSLSFQVLHEGTPGINSGHFTTMRSSIPHRRPDDQSRFDTIKVESDDSLFAKIVPARRRK